MAAPDQTMTTSSTTFPVPAAETTRRELRQFAEMYAYDNRYMEALLDMSAPALATFAAAMGMSRHRQALPIEAHYVAKLATLRADDCGACTQLNLRMAVEAGVPRELLQTALRTPHALPEELRLVYEHAQQVVRGENADAARVAQLRAHYGDAAFAELAVNIVGVRVYPAMKRALGAEHACQVPHWDF
jgi:alkylhydroperoxidase/carboxymuconolactone decarboxylase family protein YurZ